MLLISIFTIFIFSFHDFKTIKRIIGKIKISKKMKKISRIEIKNRAKKENINSILDNKHFYKKIYKANKINLNDGIKIIKNKFQNHKRKKFISHQNNISIIDIDSTKNIKGNKCNSIRKKPINNNLNYIDDELNDLDYKKAIKIDKRNYWQYYLSLLKTKHLFVFSFITNDDYNSKIIKIYLFFYTFLIDFAVNVIFYTDSTMNKIYVEEGSFNFIYQIPQMIYSSLITTVLNYIITTFGLLQGDILKIKYCDLKIVEQKTKSVLKCIKCKIVIFFIIAFIFLILFWIYIGCFCAVYKNTQFHLLIEVSSSFVTSLITPLFFNLLPGIFRIPSLNNIKSNRYILYKLSKILQIL